ncbi:MAG: hypothetical protein J6X69_06475 [Bacteroidales bacterium]|nr:hypothetical protein [Bacteroidales bacterium]
MKRIAYIGVAVFLFVLLFGCSSSNKAAKLAKRNDEVELRLPSSENVKPSHLDTVKRPESIIVKDEDGNDKVLMNAILDDETGEMVATEVLEAATITVRFKRVAERRGKVDLGFEVVVPPVLLDNQWEMQLTPELYYISDTETVLDSAYLEKINITGEVLHIRRMRANQLYGRIMQELADSGKYKGGHTLEVFVERNLPEIYSLKYDTSYVYTKEDSSKVVEELFNWYSVTDQEAIDHYSNRCALKDLRRKKQLLGTLPNPDDHPGVRIDSVIRTENGDFVCLYVETIATRPKLKKVYVYVAGDIYNENGQRIYRVPRTDSLVFNISSAAQLYKEQKRYLHRIVYRRAEVNASFKIGFEAGKSEIDRNLNENAQEMAHIKQTIHRVLQSREFDLDSVVVTAHCSPEGIYHANEVLSHKRSQSVSTYFDRYMSHVVDSLNNERGFSVDEWGNIHKDRAIMKIHFRSRAEAENWPQLNDLIRSDTTLTEDMKQVYFDDLLKIANPDVREAKLKTLPYYNYLKASVYPKLRTVDFNFHFHRRGMVKDTIMTTELDTVYARGLEYLKDRDYDHAIEILRGYPDDYNLAVCYVALDRNLSALDILEPMKRTAEVNYLLALLYSRQGDNKNAVQCYLDACHQDPSYRHRGNLDPEISILIKTYDLNADAFE